MKGGVCCGEDEEVIRGWESDVGEEVCFRCKRWSDC